MRRKDSLDLGAAALLALAAVCPARGARADEVRLDNGEVIRGELVSADEREVSWQRAQGERLRFRWTQITSIETDRAVDLRLVDGSRLRGKLERGEGPRSIVVKTEVLGPQALSVDQIVGVNQGGPAPAAPHAEGSPAAPGKLERQREPPSEEKRFSDRNFGWIDLGVTIRDDGSNGTLFGALGARKYLWSTGRISLGGVMLSPRHAFGGVELAQEVALGSYVYASGEADHDLLTELELRSRGGGGLGFTIFDREDLLLDLAAGAEYVNDDFRRDVPDRAYPAGDFSASVGAHLTEHVALWESVEVLPSLENFRRISVRSITAVHVIAHKNVAFGFYAIYEYLHPRAAGQAGDDLGFALGVTLRASEP